MSPREYRDATWAPETRRVQWNLRASQFEADLDAAYLLLSRRAEQLRKLADHNEACAKFTGADSKRERAAALDRARGLLAVCRKALNR